MADFTYESELVADPFTFQRAANSAITVYDVNDESESSPLALKDLNGLPMPNPLTSSADAFVPAFVAPSSQVKLVGGGLRVVKSCFQGVRDEAVEAKVAAQNAQTAAEGAASGAVAAVDVALAGLRDETVAAKDAALVAASAATSAASQAAGAASEALAGAVSEAQQAKNAAIAAAALVGSPADQAIATAVSGAGTATRAAVTAAISADVPGIVGKPAGVAKTADTTLVASDAGKVLTFSDAVDHFVTVPLASAAAIPAGTEVDVLSTGAGRVRFKPPAENLWLWPNGQAGSVGIWSGRVGNTSPVAGVGPNGDTVIRSTSTGTTSSGGFGMVSSIVKLTDLDLKAGDRISARMWISHILPATNARFEISFQAGTTEVSRTAQTPIAGTGVRDVVNILVPVGCDGLRIYVYSTSTAVGQTIDIAQVMLAKSTTALASYGDGRSSGWYWLGTPYASRSSNGIITGDRTVPKGGRSRIRHLGGDVWAISPLGITDSVLTEGSALNIDRDNGQGGMMGPARNIGSTSAALVSNTAYEVRICPSRNMIVKNVNFRVVTASGTDDPVDVAIIDGSGVRLSSSGSTTGRLNSTGTKSVTIPDALLLAGGVYYITLSATSTATLLHASVIGDAFGSAAPLAEAMTKAATFPIPSSLTGATVANSAPFLWVKEA